MITLKLKFEVEVVQNPELDGCPPVQNIGERVVAKGAAREKRKIYDSGTERVNVTRVPSK